MLTYSKLGKKGNLGNQLFQIAATVGLAKKNNTDYGFPDWQYQASFKNKLPSFNGSNNSFTGAEEKEYHYYDWNLGNSDYDISGWLQTEKYFDDAQARHYFEFTDDLKSSIKKRYEKAFLKRTILISIRRGDFVRHPDYFQLTIKYYMNSLARFFPDWQSANLVVLSDDIGYCKFHFSFLENVFFGENLTAAEQLCLGSLCNDFIISNSTFSWWTAWLGEKRDSKIVRPCKNFEGIKSRQSDDRDYFPERWIRYDHLDDAITLTNVSFCLKSDKSMETIGRYISVFFKTGGIGTAASVKGSVYYLRKDYFLPPMLIYSTFLKAADARSIMVSNQITKVFRVSEQLNYKEFIIDSDFGFFSKIFSFTAGLHKKPQNDFYLAPAATVRTGTIKRIDIKATAGKFCKAGGYTFSLGRYMKRTETRIKVKIKTILKLK